MKIKTLRDKLIEVRSATEKMQEFLQHSSDKKEQEILSEIVSLQTELENKIALEIEQVVEHALARVNFRDEKYRFLRAIDGDTIEVSPPEELTGWLRDIHIRLYGIDTPELSQTYGHLYKTIVHRLCSETDDCQISVIWEREKANLEYKDFPKASFERGVGNVFLSVGNQLLYLNGLLLCLRHVHIIRNEKPLINTGKFRINELVDFRCDDRFFRRCHHWLPIRVYEIFEKCDPDIFVNKHFPMPSCLFLFPKELLKTPESEPGAMHEIIINSIEHLCWPISRFLRLSDPPFASQISNRSISPFSVPLLLINEWKKQISG